MMPKVGIIILNWNGWRDTIECLESLYQIDYPNYCVVVVDNNSNDDSVKKIKEYCNGKIKVSSRYVNYNPYNKPINIIEYTEQEIKKNKIIFEKFPNKYVILIKNERNYGFTGGNNVGIKFALDILDSDYILLLNNDTIVDKYFLKELVKIAEENDNIGLVAPRQFSYWNPDEVIARAHSLSFTKLILEILPINRAKNMWDSYTREVDWAQASCLLIKKEVFKKVELLDCKFFICWEDLDLCISARKAGYKIVYNPKSKFWHKVSRSIRKSHTTCYFEARNAFLFYKKHRDYGVMIFIVVMAILFSKFVNILRIHNRKVLVSFYMGIIDGVKILLRGLSNEDCVYHSL